jgi:hypothetical protein
MTQAEVQAEVQERITQALREKAAQDSAGLQVMVAQMVQSEAAKGLFEKGSQADRVQKRNEALEGELRDARHALNLALQDRRDFRRFFSEWYDAHEDHISDVMDRVNQKMPGEE